MCKCTSCCCGSASRNPSGLGLLAAVAAGWALASAAAAILADLIDALAVATICAVAGTAVFCAWRVRVLTRPAPPVAARKTSPPARSARALPAPARRAIEAPRPLAAQPGAVHGSRAARPAAGSGRPVSLGLPEGSGKK